MIELERHSKTFSVKGAPKKVLTIAHSYCVALNRRLAHELAVQGGGKWEITAVAPKMMHGDLRRIPIESDSSEQCRTIPVPLHFSGSPHVMFYGKEFRQILRGRWDLIHCWQEPFTFVGAQAVFESASGTPFVFYSFQNIDKFYPPPFSFFERYCVAHCVGWIAAGQTVAQTLLNRGYGSRPHVVLPLGVDTNHFSPQPRAREVKRQLIGWERDGPPIIGFLGRFVREKGVEMLCEALDRTEEAFRALFVGGGPLEAYLHSWSTKYPGRIRIIKGVKHDEVPDYLNAMDVLCAPSQTTTHWREQFGRMLTEAFACGVPVAGSNSGEIPYVVGDAGLIFDEHSTSELTAVLNNLLSSPSLRQTLSEKGLERAHRLFSWSKVAADHLTFFQERLDSSGS